MLGKLSSSVSFCYNVSKRLFTEMKRKYKPYTNTMHNTLYRVFTTQVFRTVEQPRLEGNAKYRLVQPFMGKGDEIIQRSVRLQGLMGLNPDKNICLYALSAGQVFSPLYMKLTCFSLLKGKKDQKNKTTQTHTSLALCRGKKSNVP